VCDRGLQSAPPGPLSGVRVLDLIDGLGAYGPKLLTGLGAEVVRLEPPSGARDRRRPSFYQVVEAEPSLYVLHYHGGKRGVTLDCTRPAGRALLLRLLDTFDIVFDNGHLRQFGVDVQALLQQRPVVVVSVTPFGLSGPRAHWQGGDLICQAMSGMIGLFGFRDQRPARFGPEQASEMAGLAAALGALIALYGARREGNGELVDIAVERVCALVTLQMCNASIYHQFGVTRWRRSVEETMHGTLYQARDGWVLLNAYREPDRLVAMLAAAGVSGEVEELCRTLPRSAFITDPRVEETVRRFVAQRTRAEVAEQAQAQAIPCLPVHDLADLVADPFLQGRAFFVEVTHPTLGVLTDSGPPVRFSATPYRVGGRPPLLGEHNAEVYGWIGLDPADLADPQAQGVV
jgi:crotonobetainyl-CoA:carnitine CoA-transferase CaiB-like acyl-CoA transferase